MAVKIKLTRLGKIRNPQYRIIVADSRTRRDGRAIETIGKYHPKEEPSFIEIDSERAQYWLGVGAKPTEPVAEAITPKKKAAKKDADEASEAPAAEAEAAADSEAADK